MQWSYIAASISRVSTGILKSPQCSSAVAFQSEQTQIKGDLETVPDGHRWGGVGSALFVALGVA